MYQMLYGSGALGRLAELATVKGAMELKYLLHALTYFSRGP